MSGFGQAPYGAFAYGTATTPPEVVNWAPTADSAIDRFAPVHVDVLAASWELSQMTLSLFTQHTVETAWSDSTGFSEPYRRGSVKIPVENGFHFILRRTNGWPGPYIQFEVTASDLAGEAVSGQSS